MMSAARLVAPSMVLSPFRISAAVSRLVSKRCT